MRTSSLAIGVGIFLAGAIVSDMYFRPDPLPALPAGGPIPLVCDRGCLEGVIDQYLNALAVNDPTALPLSEDVRFTENSQALDVGDGFWQTASARGRYGHYFVDPTTGQAAFMGTMWEDERLVLLTLRLRVELGRITEIETTTWRDGEGNSPGLDDLELRSRVDDRWLGAIPPSGRLSRQELIVIANSYFDALEANDYGESHRFANDCQRMENGVGGLNCLEQFESGYSGVVSRVHERRFSLIDEERGVVWAYSVFDHDGTVREVSLPGGGTVSIEGYVRPSSVEVSGAFLIDGGLILGMEMVAIPAPYHVSSPWQGGLSGR